MLKRASRARVLQPQVVVKSTSSIENNVRDSAAGSGVGVVPVQRVIQLHGGPQVASELKGDRLGRALVGTVLVHDRSQHLSGKRIQRRTMSKQQMT